MLLLWPQFFVRAVRDAHADEYAEPIKSTPAVLFVVMNWRWLCRQEAARLVEVEEPGVCAGGRRFRPASPTQSR